ncbi:hypothetical protein PF008_g21099 [Phytophthora fragariae]|uniref:Uncharacterized protein n=1 Tax=Phytophthora fragariae TaxID=53985 RepID=A0A6G0QYR0_9STRA|nr:hypothetical protein PF008_g21099 [Phytophthora fragariae]
MHDPHMAAAAGAGLDVPGLSPADLQLNACLCRALAARFPEVTDIPAGETRTVESVIHPRGDGAASAPPASSNSAGLSPRLDSRTSGVSSGDGTSVPASSSAIVPPGVPAQPSSSAPAPPSKSIDQLRRARLDTLTPAEKLRRYSNARASSGRRLWVPKSSTAAGSRVKPHVPPPQPYACPLPGEEGHAEAAGQLDEAAREVGFLPSSSSLQELGPDGSHPAEFKEFADVDDSSLDFDGVGLQQISLVPYAVSPTSSSASAPSPGESTSSHPRVLNLSRGMAPLSVSTELSGVTPVDVVIDPAATSAESETVTLSAALALPSTAEYPTSVRWVPPESSGSAQTSGSVAPSTSVSASSGSTPSSAVARLLACSSQTKSTSSKSRAPSSSSASSTVLTSAPMVSSTSSRPTVPPASVAMTSPSGRPIRAKAATARMISAHCLEVLETPDYVVLGSGHSPGSPDLLDSASGPSVEGTSAHPLSVSDGSSAAGSE